MFAIALSAPATVRMASGSGLSEVLIASDPAAPGTRTSMSAPETSRKAMATMIPRGMSRRGSAVSSAASGTPSIARKNQIP